VLREQLNITVRRSEDLEQLLRLPSLGVVPALTPRPRTRLLRRSGLLRRAAPEAPDGGGAGLAVLNGRSSGAEAFRTLRTNLIFSQAAGRLRTLVVTSAAPGEGKSTIASNLAAAFAQQGMRVLLVDCDLRRARQHETFGAPREPGLTQLVLRYARLAEVALPTEVENLFLLPAGTLPPNPAELLGSLRMQEVLAELGQAFDLVLVDTPPVLAASDGAILAAGVDGVVLVVRAGRTVRGAAQQALRQLDAVGARVLGGVLNDPEERLAAYGGYGQYGGYYASYAAVGEPSSNGRPAAAHEGEKAPAPLPEGRFLEVHGNGALDELRRRAPQGPYEPGGSAGAAGAAATGRAPGQPEPHGDTADVEQAVETLLARLRAAGVLGGGRDA
jgi:capsular exopolysaccharide synthesis family protein